MYVCMYVILYFQTTLSIYIRIYIKLWVSYLRPKLDANKIWNNSFECLRLERIQRKFLKRMAGFRRLNYDVRLQRVGLSELTTIPQ